MAHPALKEVYAQLKTRMDKAVEDFRREMAATRTGRANVHMLDTVSVDYYGIADAAQPDRADSRARAADDHGAALRSFAARERSKKPFAAPISASTR